MCILAQLALAAFGALFTFVNEGSSRLLTPTRVSVVANTLSEDDVLTRFGLCSATTWWFSKPCKGELVMTCPDEHYKHNIRGVTTFNMGGASGGASVFSTTDDNIHGILSDYQVLGNAPGLSPITTKAKLADIYVACRY